MRKISTTNHAADESGTSSGDRLLEGTLADRLQVIIGSESVASFARRSGVGESLLRKYLNGALPNSNNLVLLADAGGCFVDWLASGRPPRMRADFADNLESPGDGTVAEDEFSLLKQYRAASEEEKVAVRALLDAITNPGGGAWFRAGQIITGIAHIFPRKK